MGCAEWHTGIEVEVTAPPNHISRMENVFDWMFSLRLFFKLFFIILYQYVCCTFVSEWLYSNGPPKYDTVSGYDTRQTEWRQTTLVAVNIRHQKYRPCNQFQWLRMQLNSSLVVRATRFIYTPYESDTYAKVNEAHLLLITIANDANLMCTGCMIFGSCVDPDTPRPRQNPIIFHRQEGWSSYRIHRHTLHLITQLILSLWSSLSGFPIHTFQRCVSLAALCACMTAVANPISSPCKVRMIKRITQIRRVGSNWLVRPGDAWMGGVSTPRPLCKKPGVSRFYMADPMSWFSFTSLIFVKC